MSRQSQTSERNAYSVDEFCHRVSISRASFYRLAKAGKIRLVRIGGRTVVPAAEIARLLGAKAPL
mgnify:CR=1 FL=1